MKSPVELAVEALKPFATEFGVIDRPDDFQLFGNLNLGHFRRAEEALAALQALPVREGEEEEQPIAMVLHCPSCGLQHIDEATPHWPNPPHRSHLCLGCGHIWRPADVATTGVAALKTQGKHDSPRAQPNHEALRSDGWVLVPIDPTDEMIEAAEEDMAERRSCGMRIYAADVYRALLAALPDAPVLGEGG